MSDATLTDAKPINANLTGAKLSGADLTGADLRGAGFAGTALTGAIWPANAAVPKGARRSLRPPDTGTLDPPLAPGRVPH
jgi:uncharacterized protein YjbI with pentapeptide repeats